MGVRCTALARREVVARVSSRRCRRVVLGGIASRRRLSDRPWHEPAVLFPSVAAFRDAELEALAAFVDVAAKLDDAENVPDDASLVDRGVEAAFDDNGFEESSAPPNDESDVASALRRYCASLSASGIDDRDASASTHALASRAYAVGVAEAVLSPRLARLVRRAAGPRFATRVERVSERFVSSLGRRSKRPQSEHDNANDDHNSAGGSSPLDAVFLQLRVGDDSPPPGASTTLASPLVSTKLRTALSAWRAGGWRERLEAQFALFDDDDDGLLHVDQVARAVDVLALAVGPALADAHDSTVPNALPEAKRRLKKRQEAAARMYLAFTYPIVKLDVKAKGRCLAAWADRARVDAFAPPGILSAEWLLGTAPKDQAYVDLKCLLKAVDDFFPELSSGTNKENSAKDDDDDDRRTRGPRLARAHAKALLAHRTEHWRLVEENRTSQYLTALFVVAAALLDYAIMIA